MDDVAGALRQAEVGTVVDRTEAVERYGRDASHLRGRPSAGVRPRDPDDLVRLVRWARDHRVALVARGGGTSLEGECVPADGAVVVDLSGWDRILEIAPDERLARVQPGVINRELHRALRPHRLFFPPNPGSWTTATIGGNAATNAAGPRAFRYGSARHWIRGAEVVLGTAQRATVGGRTSKRSAGPDLLAALIGSEGTLGFFSELTVSLAPAPARRTGVIVPVSPGRAIGPIVRSWVADPPGTLAAIEFLDAASAGPLAEEAGGRFPPGRDLLLLELESADEPSETAALTRLLERLPAVGVPEEPLVVADADALWTLRGRSGLALDRTMGERIREDVAVPLPRLDELQAAIGRIAETHGIPVATFGHVGDGNLHPNFGVDPEGPAADAIRRGLYAAVRSMGGTISAEHGIGALKAPYLDGELDGPSMALLRTLKRACDPDAILNPGKLLPP